MPKAYVWKTDDQSGSKPATTGSCTAQPLELQCLGTHPGTVWLAATDTGFADIDPTANTKGLLCNLAVFMTQLRSSEKVLQTRTLSKSSFPMSQGNKVAGTGIIITLYGERGPSLRHVWRCLSPSV